MPEFDVPDAMGVFYKRLEEAGWHKFAKSQVPSEWHKDTTRIEILHIARGCEITWGTIVKRQNQGSVHIGPDRQRVRKDYSVGLEGFMNWLNLTFLMIEGLEPADA